MMENKLKDLLNGIFPSPPFSGTNGNFPHFDNNHEVEFPRVEEDSTITILHLGDIRYGWKGPRNLYEKAHKKAWQALINTFRDNVIKDIGKPDIIAICGDIAYSGTREEYEQCHAEFIEPLLETVGISKEYLLTCPGNHDSDISLDDVDRYIPEKGTPIKESKRIKLAIDSFKKLSNRFNNYSESFFGSTGLETLVYTRNIENIYFLSLNSALFVSYFKEVFKTISIK